MPSALKEIGIKKAFKFFYTTLLMILYRFMIFPQMRTIFLRLCGVKIGKHTIISSDVKFINLYRTGFKGLTIGNYCFIADEAMFDLADKITLGDYVTVGWRSLIITHLNVGYKAHPLQKCFPPIAKPVFLDYGSFVGANVTILSGVTIGKCVFVAAGSVVTEDVAEYSLVAGVPARVIRKIDSEFLNI